MKIAVIFGGASDEYAVSLLSAAAVLSALDRETYEPIAIGITKNGAWLYTKATPAEIARDAWAAGGVPCLLSPDPTRRGFFLSDGRHILPDLIFPLTHGGAGEDGRMAGLFSLSGIPFLGAQTEGAALAMNKAAAKRVAREVGVPTLPHIIASDKNPAHARRAARTLGYPLFVKPLHGGSSVGAGLVQAECDLAPALARACARGDEAIIEPFCKAREIEVAIYDAGEGLVASQVGEIGFAHGGFYDYETKYEDGRARLFLADISPAQTTRVRSYAKKIFRALGLRHLARVDFFLSHGEIFFNEVNSLPGFTAGSMYPFLLAKGDLRALIPRLIAAAVAG